MKPLLIPKEVQEILQISPRTLHRWTKAGRIQSVRLASGSIRYRPEDVESLIKKSLV